MNKSDIIHFGDHVVSKLSEVGANFEALRDRRWICSSKWCGAGTAKTALLAVINSIEKQHGWRPQVSLFSMCDIVPRARQLLSCFGPEHMHKDLLEPFDKTLVENIASCQKVLLDRAVRDGTKKEMQTKFKEFVMDEIEKDTTNYKSAPNVIT